MSEKGYLQTKKLCVGYQKHIVVDNIEISLEQGEILTLIGPNGAGKSTVLKSIARQLETLGRKYLSRSERTIKAVWTTVVTEHGSCNDTKASRRKNDM